MWLDTAPHQAAGLHGLAPQRDLRLLAVLSPPEGAAAWLETLWQLCSSLQRLGYPVAVLDGTAAESRHAPGLEQLLGATPWPGAAALNAAAAGTALAVVPAARGLARLAGQARPAEALQRLHPLLRAYAIAVLYAAPEQLAPLLRGSASVPLVMTGPGAQGMVRSYMQIKHMALHAGLHCTVASILPPLSSELAPARARQTAEALATLQRSARSQLGLQIHTTTVTAARAQDIQRLALQLLENACTIDAAMPHSLCAHAAHPDRSH